VRIPVADRQRPDNLRRGEGEVDRVFVAGTGKTACVFSSPSARLATWSAANDPESFAPAAGRRRAPETQ
jgi:hypothetical protein